MCSSAPSPDPLIGQAAKLNAQTAQEALDWYKGVYQTEIAPRMAQDQELRSGLIGDLRDTMQQQNDFARDQNAFYKSTFQPVEQQMVRDAENYDSQENLDRRMGIAAANVNQQFSNAAGQQARLLSRYGLNPNSSTFARENAKLFNQQALASAGAQTGAAFDTMDRAIALRAGAANFGRNMPNTAATYYGMSGNSANSAAGISGGGMGVATNGIGVMGQGFNTNIAGNQSAGNLMLGDFQARMQGYQASQQAMGGLFSGLGMLGGMALGAPVSGGGSVFGNLFKAADGGHVDARGLRHYAGGGEVDGPGGPVDDKVPAMLSDGEYVIPADVVKAKGVEFFDKLREKYHTPAAMQRRGIRRA